MNHDDIIRLAREAGMPPVEIASDKPVLYPAPDAIERFAALVAAAAKAEVCDDKAPPCPTCVSLARAVMMDQVGKA